MPSRFDLWMPVFLVWSGVVVNFVLSVLLIRHDYWFVERFTAHIHKQIRDAKRDRDDDGEWWKDGPGAAP